MHFQEDSFTSTPVMGTHLTQTFFYLSCFFFWCKITLTVGWKYSHEEVGVKSQNRVSIHLEKKQKGEANTVKMWRWVERRRKSDRRFESWKVLLLSYASTSPFQCLPHSHLHFTFKKMIPLLLVQLKLLCRWCVIFTYHMSYLRDLHYSISALSGW